MSNKVRQYRNVRMPEETYQRILRRRDRLIRYLGQCSKDTAEKVVLCSEVSEQWGIAAYHEIERLLYFQERFELRRKRHAEKKRQRETQLKVANNSLTILGDEK